MNQIELFEIQTEFKEMTYDKLNFLKTEMFDYLTVNEWLVFHWIVTDTYQYLEPFNYVQKRFV